MIFSHLMDRVRYQIQKRKIQTAFRLGLIRKSQRIHTCLICGSSQLQPLPETFSEFGISISLSKCDSCSIVFQNPRIHSDQLPFYYSKLYRPPFRGIHYQNSRFARNQKRGQALKRFLNKALPDFRPNRILELGCGYGGVIDSFRTPTNSVMGLEWDPDCVAYCNRKGIPTRSDSIQNVTSSGFSPDLVLLSHFLEHSENPIVLISEIQKSLSKNSVVLVEIPRLDFGIARVFQQGHLFYFTPETLNILFEGAGFALIQSELSRDLIRAIFQNSGELESTDPPSSS